MTLRTKDIDVFGLMPSEEVSVIVELPNWFATGVRPTIQLGAVPDTITFAGVIKEGLLELVTTEEQEMRFPPSDSVSDNPEIAISSLVVWFEITDMVGDMVSTMIF